MSSSELPPQQQPESRMPNDRKLFVDALKQMIDITLMDGYTFPAVELTEEEREENRLYVEGGLPDTYSTCRYDPEYAAQRGITNDSRTNYGMIVTSSGEQLTATVVVLGEGPSIKYGEFGRLYLFDGPDLYEHTEYAFNTDGTVTMAHAIYDEPENMIYADDPHQTNDEELQKLVDDLRYWQNNKPVEIEDPDQ